MLKLFRSKEMHSIVVYNLDKVKTQTVEFVLHGKTHKIRPLETGEFLEWAVAYSQFANLSEKENITPDELENGFYQVFHSVCKTLTRKDVSKCSQQQASVLFGLIVNAITGKAAPDLMDPGLKKKVNKAPPLNMRH